jgi:hypothetical protein
VVPLRAGLCRLGGHSVLGATSVYPRMYALAMNRTQISVAKPEKMRVRACKKTSKASRLDEKKPESTALGKATELTGDGPLV